MVKSVLRVVGRPGLEPGTNALKGQYFTNTSPCVAILLLFLGLMLRKRSASGREQIAVQIRPPPEAPPSPKSSFSRSLDDHVMERIACNES